MLALCQHKETPKRSGLPLPTRRRIGSGIDISTAIELSLFISMEILDSNLWLVPFAGRHASWYDT